MQIRKSVIHRLTYTQDAQMIWVQKNQKKEQEKKKVISKQNKEKMILKKFGNKRQLEDKE